MLRQLKPVGLDAKMVNREGVVLIYDSSSVGVLGEFRKCCFQISSAHNENTLTINMDYRNNAHLSHIV